MGRILGEGQILLILIANINHVTSDCVTHCERFISYSLRLNVMSHSTNHQIVIVLGGCCN